MIEVECPVCKAVTGAPDDMAGLATECKYCGKETLVPQEHSSRSSEPISALVEEKKPQEEKLDEDKKPFYVARGVIILFIMAQLCFLFVAVSDLMRRLERSPYRDERSGELYGFVILNVIVILLLLFVDQVTKTVFTKPLMAHQTKLIMFKRGYTSLFYSKWLHQFFYSKWVHLCLMWFLICILAAGFELGSRDFNRFDEVFWGVTILFPAFLFLMVFFKNKILMPKE